MAKRYKWGILAPGRIAAKFTNGLKVLENAELYAVGSRDAGRAKRFAEEHGFRKSLIRRTKNWPVILKWM